MTKGKKKMREGNETNGKKTLDIDLNLKVHLTIALSPHSSSDVFRKQHVMPKVGVSCRKRADGKRVLLSGNQKSREF